MTGGVTPFFWRASSRIALMRPRSASDRSDKSLIGVTSSTCCTGGCCSVKARAPRRNTALSVDVRKSCARVTSASLQAKMLMMI